MTGFRWRNVFVSLWAQNERIRFVFRFARNLKRADGRYGALETAADRVLKRAVPDRAADRAEAEVAGFGAQPPGIMESVTKPAARPRHNALPRATPFAGRF